MLKLFLFYSSELSRHGHFINVSGNTSIWSPYVLTHFLFPFMLCGFFFFTGISFHFYLGHWTWNTVRMAHFSSREWFCCLLFSFSNNLSTGVLLGHLNPIQGWNLLCHSDDLELSGHTWAMMVFFPWSSSFWSSVEDQRICQGPAHT